MLLFAFSPFKPHYVALSMKLVSGVKPRRQSVSDIAYFYAIYSEVALQSRLRRMNPLLTFTVDHAKTRNLIHLGLTHEMHLNCKYI